jgi:ketosteroid isomerase-like protein
MDISTLIQAYVDATNAQDPNAVAALFRADASVHDEGGVHSGTEAIRAWAADTMDRYQSKMRPETYTADRAILTAEVSGTFDGSPIWLDFEFVLEEGQIASLTIRSTPGR